LALDTALARKLLVEPEMSTTPAFTTAAFGRIERKKAKASTVLRRTLVCYLEHIQASRSRQAWFIPQDVVLPFRTFALEVFDAVAEEHLLVTNQSPQDFVQFLRHDLISDVWHELKAGVWRRIVEEALTLSRFVFPQIPGRSIRKEELLFPQGRGEIEAVLLDRIDNFWVEKSWNDLERRATEQEAYSGKLPEVPHPATGPVGAPNLAAAQDLPPEGATSSGEPAAEKAQEFQIGSAIENTTFRGLPERAVTDDGPKPDRRNPRKRGRPMEIPATAKRDASEVRARGGTWREVARVLYQVPYPTESQVKNAANVLKHFRRVASVSP
jgi:hypothetical protein